MGGDTLDPVSRPILRDLPVQRKNVGAESYTDAVDMFWGAIPSALAAATPHRCGSAAHGTWVVDEWYSVHVGKKLRVYSGAAGNGFSNTTH